jgi:hypothetical protein
LRKVISTLNSGKQKLSGQKPANGYCAGVTGSQITIRQMPAKPA